MGKEGKSRTLRQRFGHCRVTVFIWSLETLIGMIPLGACRISRFGIAGLAGQDRKRRP